LIFLTNRERNISVCFLNYFFKLTPSNNFWKWALITDKISYSTMKSNSITTVSSIGTIAGRCSDQRERNITTGLFGLEEVGIPNMTSRSRMTQTIFIQTVVLFENAWIPNQNVRSRNPYRDVTILKIQY
jgi:hypothetical protein